MFETVFLLFLSLCKPQAISAVSKAHKLDFQQNGGVSFANFMPLEFSYLNVSRLETLAVSDFFDCGVECIKSSSCFSINVATSPQNGGKLQCELLPTDKYNASEKLEVNNNFHHYSLYSPCSTEPCKNEGVCIAHYDNNDYECACPPGYKGERCETGFLLSFPIQNMSDYVISRKLPSLQAFTICLWLRSAGGPQVTPFSYAVYGGSTNELTLSYMGYIYLSVGGDYTSNTKVSANDGNPHHMCVTWENVAGNWNLYKDGALEKSGTELSKGHTIPGGGFFILGQEQDSVGGGFDLSQSFVGVIRDVNVWDHVIGSDVISRMSKSCYVEGGRVLKWSEFISGIHGNVVMQQLNVCGL